MMDGSKTSPPAVVTATEVAEDQLPSLVEPDADNDPQNYAPLQIDEQEEVPMLCSDLYYSLLT